MFEEAQLYSPVTTTADGTVTVHLADDHPGAGDPEYRERRNAIAALAIAWEPGTPSPQVDYSDDEHEVWRRVCAELAPKWDRYACRAFLEARDRLDLPTDHIPQLDEISGRMRHLTGFTYVPAAGVVGLREFYASLGDDEFHSTQYVRHHGAPLYTPEPDLIHEVLGHGIGLADPQIAELTRLAGRAAQRVETERALQFLADVFWFTLEFGVVHEDGEPRAYGAGILSSFGEIEEFRRMEIRDLDFWDMGTLAYDITHYQPVLFAAASMTHLVDRVGGFFAAFDDDTPRRLEQAATAIGRDAGGGTRTPTACATRT